ncbi:predicted protein [Arabidopsis lyrata subsp. lyrata]|uniref:Predicted protein n=1 Tax=Arabidopsis lyrata subsp. lyrata TaxID=81972 RepID=D7L6B4_ARALL|nr:predicted protein [Arabidopsis lyrata subsp. lyrata]
MFTLKAPLFPLHVVHSLSISSLPSKPLSLLCKKQTFFPNVFVVNSSKKWSANSGKDYVMMKNKNKMGKKKSRGLSSTKTLQNSRSNPNSHNRSKSNNSHNSRFKMFTLKAPLFPLHVVHSLSISSLPSKPLSLLCKKQTFFPNVFVVNSSKKWSANSGKDYVMMKNKNKMGKKKSRGPVKEITRKMKQRLEKRKINETWKEVESKENLTFTERTAGAVKFILRWRSIIGLPAIDGTKIKIWHIFKKDNGEIVRLILEWIR